MLAVSPLFVTTGTFSGAAIASQTDEHPQSLDERIQCHEANHSILKDLNIKRNYFSSLDSIIDISFRIELG